MRLNNLFPSYLNEDFEIVHGLLPPAQLPPFLRNHFSYIGMEKVITDCRIYNPWPVQSLSISENQSKILKALYTKHHDGYIREKCLHSILGFDDEWIPPFVFHLLGEYVIGIVDLINKNKEVLIQKEAYSSFIKCNADYLKFIESRCISYWDCYYRGCRYKYKEDYPGIVCLNYLRKHAH